MHHFLTSECVVCSRLPAGMVGIQHGDALAAVAVHGLHYPR